MKKAKTPKKPKPKEKKEKHEAPKNICPECGADLNNWGHDRGCSRGGWGGTSFGYS